MIDILDCGDAPGAAMAGLRAGLRYLVLNSRVPAWPRVAAIAAGLGGVVLAERPQGLDLADRGSLRQLRCFAGETHS